MTYRELIRIILRRWWLIGLPFVLSAALALPQLFSSPAGGTLSYNAQIRYSAAQKLNLPEREGDYTDIWLASERTVAAMSAWARSSSFRQKAREQLGEAGAALDSLHIAADHSRNIGIIYLSHPDPEALGAIADAVLLVLSNQNQHYLPQLGGEAAQVTILDQPVMQAAPPPLTNRFAPLIQLGIGLAIGLALAFLAEYIDPRIYHQDDLRRMGLPLLGSVPSERA